MTPTPEEENTTNKNEGEQVENPVTDTPQTDTDNTDTDNPDKGKTDTDTDNPDKGKTDTDTDNPDKGKTDTDTDNPDKGKTDPDKGKTDPDKGKTDPDKGKTPEEEKPIASTAVAQVEPKKSTAQEMEELKSVTVDTAFANSAFNTLAGMPFDRLIGNPLRAAVKAQRDLAKEALSYIKDEAIKVDKDGKGQLSYVTLNFIKNGKQAQMRIPLLTLIPYPSLAISTMTYKFTATIEASSNAAVAVGCDLPTVSKSDASKTKATASVDGKGTSQQATTGNTKGAATDNAASKVTAPATEAAQKAAASLQKANENSNFTAAYSAKRDSAAMRDSRYSVETTIDITITATNQQPPSGISKILDVLSSSTEVVNSDGELQISAEQLTLVNGHAVLSATYRNGEGEYKREEVKCTPLDKDGAAPEPLSNGDDVLFLFSKKGTYLVKAGIFQRVVFVS